MQNLKNESSKLNLIVGQKALHKKFNKPLHKINRLKSQDDINQIEKNGMNTFNNKHTPIKPLFNKNILIKNTLKKINKKEIKELISHNTKTKKRNIKNIPFKTITPNKNCLEKRNDIEKDIPTNSIYDDMKIRNIIMLLKEL